MSLRIKHELCKVMDQGADEKLWKSEVWPLDL